MKCPIEGIECGNASTNTDGRKVCAGGNYGDMDLNGWDIIGFTRCPFPSRIKEVSPDPGEGYEIVPYDPKTRIESDWSVWCDGVNEWRESTRVGNNMFSPGPMPVYRRPKYAVCPVSGERCRYVVKCKTCLMCCGDNKRRSVLEEVTWERCPFPSLKKA